MKGKKTGGRKKGTPNKVSGDMKAVLAAFVSEYYDSGEFKKDFYSMLDPKDRLEIVAKILPFFMTKMQAVQADINATTTKTIEDDLIRLSQQNE